MSVLNLSDYRKPKTYEQLHQDEKIFHCGRCDSARFKLWVSGVVTCASCGVMVKDLVVRRT